MQSPAQTQHRFSVTDYYRMAQTGVLKPEARVELLDGNIIDMSPIGPLHAGLVKRLNRLLNKMAGGRWLVSTQDPLHINDFSEPQPDIMLLKPVVDDYMTRHPVAEDVFLLIEVADTTFAYDREQKLPLYGHAGISEVWVVNLLEKSIEVCREPHFSGYSNQRIFRDDEKISLLQFPDLEIDLAEIFTL